MASRTDTHRPAFVAALLEPQAYAPEGFVPEAVDFGETHISYLFFTGPYVYKVKKAVDLGFLDFSTLERRHEFCELEVALNRDIAPSVYLGVVPVTKQADDFALGGGGEVVDWAVKMRQLPRERMLDAMLARGEVTPADAERLAHRIADFHLWLPATDEARQLGGLASVRAQVEDNFAQTERFVGRHLSRAVFDDVAAYSRAFMDVRVPLFEQRSAEGRVVDGHGDLHAGQINLTNGIEIMDRIEFDGAYRCGDVAADLAFLAMDLDHFGRPDLSAALVDAYVARTGDGGLRAVLGFYQCYRAYVRGKVTSLKLATSALPDTERRRTLEAARAYYELANRYAMACVPVPALYLVVGLPGSGKSTVAATLGERWGIAHVSSDVERKRLAGFEPTARPVDAGVDVYTPGMDRRTYQRLIERAREELSAGRSVVLDATFRSAAGRREALRVAEEAGAPALVVECTLPAAVVRRRIEDRVLPTCAGAGNR